MGVASAKLQKHELLGSCLFTLVNVRRETERLLRGNVTHNSNKRKHKDLYCTWNFPVDPQTTFESFLLSQIISLNFTILHVLKKDKFCNSSNNSKRKHYPWNPSLNTCVFIFLSQKHYEILVSLFFTQILIQVVNLVNTAIDFLIH